MKGGNDMIITAQSLSALVRIVVGCMPPIGKEKRRNNEAHLVSCALKAMDVSFQFFRKGLSDGTEMYDAIANYADRAGNSIIDLNVVANYFGGVEHILKTKNELKEADVNKNSYFYLHTLFAHTLIPAEVTEINGDGLFSAVYRNPSGCEVGIKNVMTFSADRKQLKKGGMVLLHFPLLVAFNPSTDLVDKLITEQSRSADFMRCCNFFSNTGLDHGKIRIYNKWISDSMEKYEL